MFIGILFRVLFYLGRFFYASRVSCVQLIVTCARYKSSFRVSYSELQVCCCNCPTSGIKAMGFVVSEVRVLVEGPSKDEVCFWSNRF